MRKFVVLSLLVASLLNPFSVSAQSVHGQYQATILQLIDAIVKAIAILQEQLNILIAKQTHSELPKIVFETPSSTTVASTTTVIAPTTAERDDGMQRIQKLQKSFKQKHHQCSVFNRNDNFQNSNQEWCDNKTGIGVDVNEINNAGGWLDYCEKNYCKCTPRNDPNCPY